MADENTPEITKGTAVLTPGVVGKVFTPMGRDYQLVWLTTGEFQYRPEQCIRIDVLRDVLREAREALDACDVGHLHRRPRKPVVERIDALLAQLGEQP